MRFIHMADIHLDSPFRVLASKEDFADKRRLEQRESFKKVIKYIKEEKISFLFISGDLYEQEYVRESTIEYINNLFKEIPNTKIFISPGNHDPYLLNSFYNTFNWNENVTIFDGNIKRIELEEADIYGYGFSDFYCINSKVEEIEIKNKEKINILIVHGSLDASKTQDLQYNPINSAKLRNVGFDYVAMGHIHKGNFQNNENKFIYPGSLISFGFDELGEHGILDIKINNDKKTDIEFIKIEDEIFEEKKININDLNSEEEIIEKINSEKYEENKFYKIILMGNKNLNINTRKILKLINHKNILKIKDKTEIEYNLNSLTEQKNLKGIFIKKLLEKNKENPEQENIIKEAIKIGLKAFE